MSPQDVQSSLTARIIFPVFRVLLTLTDGRLYLTEVAVRSDCRRLGVGRVLLGMVDDVARELQTSEVGSRKSLSIPGSNWPK